ncbi:Serine/threonine-protein kinase SRPK [Beauveria bassiana]|nr:Serine/threonine-protein kinase SRPK [Beauveria bassiana]KAH8709079.1 Serine/threonine-protein kinase SRPK [Beauveria bassiana]
MINLIKATLANVRGRCSKLSAPLWRIPASTPVNSRRFLEEPDIYRPGGFHPVSLGDTFNNKRYTVLRKLGYGQYSTVWLARDSKCQRYVALKLLRAACYGGSHDIFERENLSSISEVSRRSSHKGHKNLLHLLEQFNHKGPNGDHVCLVFDVLGHHLDFQTAKYKDGRLPVKAVKEIARHLLMGLDFLHRECGIIHTDLKPTNILLELENPNETISKYLESVPPRTDERQDGAIVPLRESFALRAPEVTIGAPWDTAVDIWSLGCLVVEFVQGIVLFSGNASERGTWTAEDDHLARIVEILGPFPSSLLKKGRHSADLFDEQGKLIRIPNLKATSLERLLNGKVKPLIKPDDMPDTEIGSFIDFIKSMLAIDPMARKSAAELLKHEWLS